MNDTTKKTILVTGSNKGIGYAIIEKFLQKPEHFNLIMTSRAPENGEAAISTLTSLYPTKPKPALLQLDLLSQTSLTTFPDRLSALNLGKVDIFIHNAGIFKQQESFENMMIEWNTNYAHTRLLNEKVLSAGLIAQNGKIIFVSSQLGRVEHIAFNSEVHKVFSAYKTLSLEELDKWGARCVKDVEKAETRGNWQPKFYCATKMFLSAYASVLGRDEEIVGNGVQVYSMHPGWCRTDMTKHYEEKGVVPPLSKEEGAETAVWLSDLPFEIDGELQGEYFADSEHGSFL
jgi:NAD(P)-dependent dehydrogenase (short-subunit alcohol dehydrogenase family)